MGFRMKRGAKPNFKNLGSSPVKQEGPIDEKQLKLQKSEHKDTHVTKDKGKSERIIGLEDRIGFINEDISNQDKGATDQQKKDKAKLQQELAILKKSKHSTKPPSPVKQREERHKTGVTKKQHQKIKKTSAAYKKTLRKGSGASQEEKARAGKAAMNAMF